MDKVDILTNAQLYVVHFVRQYRSRDSFLTHLTIIFYQLCCHQLQRQASVKYHCIGH